MYAQWRIAQQMIGMRTLKTALAVTVALLIVEQYGLSTAKVVFATIGAMSAVAPTFKASVDACLTQICGVSVGALLGIVLTELAMPKVFAVGIGVIFILAVYQLLPTKLLPVLPCLVLVNICLNDEVVPIFYVVERGWDTAIGLGVGLLVNLLIYPYDNSRKIRAMMVGLDEVLRPFLEDLFDGDQNRPEASELNKRMDLVEQQLLLFSEQFLLDRSQQKWELKRLERCGATARMLVVELETLRNMDHLGQLSQENCEALEELGAHLPENSQPECGNEEEIVTNYHVRHILNLWKELQEQLQKVQQERGNESR